MKKHCETSKGISSLYLAASFKVLFHLAGIIKTTSLIDTALKTNKVFISW
jgi:hypothetical protein